MKGEPELKADVILPAAAQRGAAEVYVASAGIGLWTFFTAGYLLWSVVGDAMWLVKLLAFLLWPVVWLAGLVAFSQVLMGLAQLAGQVFHHKDQGIKRSASVTLLVGFSAVAATLLMDLRVIPGFLGGAWFAGCVVALVREMCSIWRSTK